MSLMDGFVICGISSSGSKYITKVILKEQVVQENKEICFSKNSNLIKSSSNIN